MDLKELAARIYKLVCRCCECMDDVPPLESDLAAIESELRAFGEEQFNAGYRLALVEFKATRAQAWTEAHDQGFREGVEKAAQIADSEEYDGCTGEPLGHVAACIRALAGKEPSNG